MRAEDHRCAQIQDACRALERALVQSFWDAQTAPIKRSRELLCSILSDAERATLERFGEIAVVARSGRLYLINHGTQTRIFGRPGGDEIGRACLQLTVDAPSYDRMIAEYLLLRNDERRYRRTANIAMEPWSQWNVWALLMLALDIGLVTYLGLRYDGAFAVNLACVLINAFSFCKIIGRDRHWTSWMGAAAVGIGALINLFVVIQFFKHLL